MTSTLRAMLVAATLLPAVSGFTAALVSPASSADGQAAPAELSQRRVGAYVLGVMLQQIAKECPVKATDAQRSALDTKLDGMKTEMSTIDADVRKQVAGRPAPHCPTKENEPRFDITLADFLANSPEDFAALMEKRGAEEAAEQKAQPGAAEPTAPKP